MRQERKLTTVRTMEMIFFYFENFIHHEFPWTKGDPQGTNSQSINRFLKFVSKYSKAFGTMDFGTISEDFFFKRKRSAGLVGNQNYQHVLSRWMTTHLQNSPENPLTDRFKNQFVKKFKETPFYSDAPMLLRQQLEGIIKHL